MLLLLLQQCSGTGGWLVKQRLNSNIAMPSELIPEFWRGLDSALLCKYCLWCFQHLFLHPHIEKEVVSVLYHTPDCQRCACCLLAFFFNLFCILGFAILLQVSSSNHYSAILFGKSLKNTRVPAPHLCGTSNLGSLIRKSLQSSALLTEAWHETRPNSCSGRSTGTQSKVTHL